MSRHRITKGQALLATGILATTGIGWKAADIIIENGNQPACDVTVTPSNTPHGNVGTIEDELRQHGDGITGDVHYFDRGGEPVDGLQNNGTVEIFNVNPATCHAIGGRVVGLDIQHAGER